MSASAAARMTRLALDAVPLLFLAVVLLLFGSLSPRFLTPHNLVAVAIQSTWLVTLALGLNFVLLTGAVDLSAGSIMYVTAVGLGLWLPGQPTLLWIIGALAIGALLGAINAAITVYGRIAAFIVTLAMAFVARGVGLWLSGTQMVFADPVISDLGRGTIVGLPFPLLVAAATLLCAATLLGRTLLGMTLRATGASFTGALRAGLPRDRARIIAFMLSGALAGLAGFVLLSQSSAATAAFGLNAEFLGIAAAVLGGTSLFGGRGTAWAPVLGGVLITTVQNGLVLIDANPYAYPVVTGGIILLAAALDSVRARINDRVQRRRILVA